MNLSLKNPYVVSFVSSITSEIIIIALSSMYVLFDINEPFFIIKLITWLISNILAGLLIGIFYAKKNLNLYSESKAYVSKLYIGYFLWFTLFFVFGFFFFKTPHALANIQVYIGVALTYISMGVNLLSLYLSNKFYFTLKAKK